MFFKSAITGVFILCAPIAFWVLFSILTHPVNQSAMRIYRICDNADFYYYAALDYGDAAALHLEKIHPEVQDVVAQVVEYKYSKTNSADVITNISIMRVDKLPKNETLAVRGATELGRLEFRTMAEWAARGRGFIGTTARGP